MNRVRLLCGLSVMTILVTLVACAAPATEAPTAEMVEVEVTRIVAGTPEVQIITATPEPEAEPITLEVWDIWTRDLDSQFIDTLDAEFEAAHPGVTINRVVKSFDDMKTTVKLALSSEDGPDVAQINQGESDMGALVKAGLLMDLGPYAEQYGWYDRISAGIVARNSYADEGKVFGEGKLYGMAPVAELVGAYYRKDIYEELGLGVPKTFAEFEEQLETIKAAGYVPITFGNLGGLTLTWLHGEILNMMIGEERSYMDDLIYGRGNASWDTPLQVAGAAKVQEWVEKDYFTPGFAGIERGDASSLYDNGEGVLYIEGSWMSSTFGSGPFADQIGFFLIPPETEGGYKMSIGGTSTAYAIRASTSYADLAVEYVDWMMSERAAQGWAKNVSVPVAPMDTSLLEPDTLFSDLVIAWSYMNEVDAVGHYLDWATPTFYDTITAANEELMGFQVTPEEYVQKLEADYAAYMAEKAAE